MTETRAAGARAGDAGDGARPGDAARQAAGAPTSGPPAGPPTSGPPGMPPEAPSSGPPHTGHTRPTSAPPSAGGSDRGGRAPVVGRASVPGETTGSRNYTRAPGMPAPPDALVPAQGPSDTQRVAGPAGAGGGKVSVGKTAARAAAAAAGVATGRASARGAAPVGIKPPGGGGGGPATGSARVTEAVRSARATVTSAAGRGSRRARLHVKRIDPWSTMKFSFAVSLVLFVVAIVATSVLYLALDAMGVFDAVNRALAEMVGNAGGDAQGGFRITAKGVVGGSAILGAVNVVLFTALATLGAFIYNVCADLVGGIELTLAEKD